MHPKFEVNTVTGTDSTIEKWLYSEKFELALLGARGDLPMLDYISLIESNTILVTHKSNPLSMKASVKLEELANEVFLCGSTDFYATNRLFLICNLLGFTPKVKHKTENILFIAKLVAHNQGILFCPDNSVQYFDHPDICQIHIIDDPKTFCVYIASKKNHYLSEGAKILKEYIMDKNIKFQ